MNNHTLRRRIEALIFAAPEPVSAADILKWLEDDTAAVEVESQLQQLIDEHSGREGGFLLTFSERGYFFQVQEQWIPLVEKMFLKSHRPLSRAAQETLAIIAYRQPVSRADIEYIRGVDSGSIIKNLLEKELIVCYGKSDKVGKPLVFGTSDKFLSVYGLRSLRDLPPIESFQPNTGKIKQAYEALQQEHGEPTPLKEIII